MGPLRRHRGAGGVHRAALDDGPTRLAAVPALTPVGGALDWRVHAHDLTAAQLGERPNFVAARVAAQRRTPGSAMGAGADFASVYGTEGLRFESCRARRKTQEIGDFSVSRAGCSRAAS